MAFIKICLNWEGFERNFINTGEGHNNLNNTKRLEPTTFSLRAFWTKEEEVNLKQKRNTMPEKVYS